jgi:hypothetical protein
MYHDLGRSRTPRQSPVAGLGPRALSPAYIDALRFAYEMRQS